MSQRTILVGIGGGIAAYKTAEVVSRLTQDGHHVTVAMTRAARRFVDPTTFAALTRQRVLLRMFPDPETSSGTEMFPHLYPASHADVFLVAPATADLLARLARGMGDDVVTASALALPAAALRFFCPAMNSGMWAQDIVQINARELVRRGWRQLGPAAGVLACGSSGPGRMWEAVDIVRAVRVALAEGERWRNRRALILSGPTREAIDPVRFITNASSGRMGQALAEAAAAQGADVIFVTGPVAEARLPSGPRVDIRRVTTAAEMRQAAIAAAPDCDAIFCAAAVADWTPARPAAAKSPKSARGLTLALAPTPDIAAELGAQKRTDQVLVGFALDTTPDRARAAEKLRKKNLDGIVLNTTAAMEAEGGHFQWLKKTEAADWEDWGELDKPALARRLLEFAARRLGLPPAPAGS